MKRNEYLPLNLIDKMNSRVSMLVSVAALAVICLLFNRLDYHMIRKPAEEANKAALARQEETVEEVDTKAGSVVNTASILAVGDNLISGGILSSGQSDSDGWNYSSLYANVSGRIQAADLAIISQETPFTSSHDSASGSLPYATPTEVGDALIGAGFDVFCCASEYMALAGESALTDTMGYFASHPEVKALGVHENSDNSVTTISVNGITIGLLNYVIPISGQTINIGASSESVPEYYYDDDDEVYYIYNAEEDSWYASDSEPVSSVSALGDGQNAGAYALNVFDKEQVASMVSQARNVSDCVIFCAHWGKGNEPMPTEYEKQWANFLLSQGVDVLIGSYPNVLSPYCTLQDEDGNSMLIYYSLGNFMAEGENLKQLIGGMASFTITKDSNGDSTVVSVTDADLELVVPHVDDSNGEYAAYLLSDYSDTLAGRHNIVNYFDEDFSVSRIQTKADEILSMMVTPSAKTSMMSCIFDSQGNIYDSEGNWMEDTDSISSVQYYSG